MTRWGCCGAWAVMLWAPLAVVDADDTSEALGDRYMAEGRYRLAVQAFEQAVQRQPKSAERRRKLAAAYVEDQQLAAAVAAYQKAIARRADYAKARTELAILLTRLDRHDEAVATLEEAIELSPDYAWAHLSLDSSTSARGTTTQRKSPIAAPSPPKATTARLGTISVKSSAN